MLRMPGDKLKHVLLLIGLQLFGLESLRWYPELLPERV
jgi:hypothetical protein